MGCKRTWLLWDRGFILERERERKTDNSQWLGIYFLRKDIYIRYGYAVSFAPFFPLFFSSVVIDLTFSIPKDLILLFIFGAQACSHYFFFSINRFLAWALTHNCNSGVEIRRQ